MPEQYYHRKTDKEKMALGLDNRSLTPNGMAFWNTVRKQLQKMRDHLTLGIHLLQIIQGKYADLSYCITYIFIHDTENIITIKTYQLRVQVEASNITISKQQEKKKKTTKKN